MWLLQSVCFYSCKSVHCFLTIFSNKQSYQGCRNECQSGVAWSLRSGISTSNSNNGFIVWSLTKSCSTDFTHYPWLLCLVAYGGVQPHTALITMDQVTIYAPGWREAQSVLAPCISVLAQKVASDGFEPMTIITAVHCFQRWGYEIVKHTILRGKWLASAPNPQFRRPLLCKTCMMGDIQGRQNVFESGGAKVVEMVLPSRV